MISSTPICSVFLAVLSLLAVATSASTQCDFANITLTANTVLDASCTNASFTNVTLATNVSLTFPMFLLNTSNASMSLRAINLTYGAFIIFNWSNVFSSSSSICVVADSCPAAHTILLNGLSGDQADVGFYGAVPPFSVINISQLVISGGSEISFYAVAFSSFTLMPYSLLTIRDVQYFHILGAISKPSAFLSNNGFRLQQNSSFLLQDVMILPSGGGGGAQAVTFLSIQLLEVLNGSVFRAENISSTTAPTNVYIQTANVSGGSTFCLNRMTIFFSGILSIRQLIHFESIDVSGDNSLVQFDRLVVVDASQDNSTSIISLERNAFQIGRLSLLGSRVAMNLSNWNVNFSSQSILIDTAFLSGNGSQLFLVNSIISSNRSAGVSINNLLLQNGSAFYVENTSIGSLDTFPAQFGQVNVSGASFFRMAMMTMVKSNFYVGQTIRFTQSVSISDNSVFLLDSCFRCVIFVNNTLRLENSSRMLLFNLLFSATYACLEVTGDLVALDNSTVDFYNWTIISTAAPSTVLIYYMLFISSVLLVQGGSRMSIMSLVIPTNQFVQSGLYIAELRVEWSSRLRIGNSSISISSVSPAIDIRKASVVEASSFLVDNVNIKAFRILNATTIANGSSLILSSSTFIGDPAKASTSSSSLSMAIQFAGLLSVDNASYCSLQNLLIPNGTVIMNLPQLLLTRNSSLMLSNISISWYVSRCVMLSSVLCDVFSQLVVDRVVALAPNGGGGTFLSVSNVTLQNASVFLIVRSSVVIPDTLSAAVLFIVPATSFDTFSIRGQSSFVLESNNFTALVPLYMTMVTVSIEGQSKWVMSNCTLSGKFRAFSSDTRWNLRNGSLVSFVNSTLTAVDSDGIFITAVDLADRSNLSIVSTSVASSSGAYAFSIRGGIGTNDTSSFLLLQSNFTLVSFSINALAAIFVQNFTAARGSGWVVDRCRMSAQGIGLLIGGQLQLNFWSNVNIISTSIYGANGDGVRVTGILLLQQQSLWSVAGADITGDGLAAAGIRFAGGLEMTGGSGMRFEARSTIKGISSIRIAVYGLISGNSSCLLTNMTLSTSVGYALNITASNFSLSGNSSFVVRDTTLLHSGTAISFLIQTDTATSISDGSAFLLQNLVMPCTMIGSVSVFGAVIVVNKSRFELRDLSSCCYGSNCFFLSRIDVAFGSAFIVANVTAQCSVAFCFTFSSGLNFSDGSMFQISDSSLFAKNASFVILGSMRLSSSSQALVSRCNLTTTSPFSCWTMPASRSSTTLSNNATWNFGYNNCTSTGPRSSLFSSDAIVAVVPNDMTTSSSSFVTQCNRFQGRLVQAAAFPPQNTTFLPCRPRPRDTLSWTVGTSTSSYTNSLGNMTLTTLISHSFTRSETRDSNTYSAELVASPTASLTVSFGSETISHNIRASLSGRITSSLTLTSTNSHDPRASLSMQISSTDETNVASSTLSETASFGTPSSSGSLYILPPGVRHVPPLSTALEAVTSLITATVLPSTGMAVQRTVLINSLAQCDFSFVDPLDLASSPTQMLIGDEENGYLRGAVVGNWLVWIGFACFGYGGSLMWACVTGRRGRGGGGGSVVECADSACLPGLLIVPFAFLLQPTVTASVALLFHSQGSLDASIGAVSLLLIFAICLAMTLTMTVWFASIKMPVDDEDDEEARRLQWQRVVLSTLHYIFSDGHEWMDTSSDLFRFTARYGKMFEPCRGGMHGFALYEVLNTVVGGVIGGVMPGDDASCRGLLITLACLAGVYVVAVLVCRPYGARIDKVVALFGGGCVFIISVMALVGNDAGTSGTATVLIYGSLVSVVLFVVQVIILTRLHKRLSSLFQAVIVLLTAGDWRVRTAREKMGGSVDNFTRLEMPEIPSNCFFSEVVRREGSGYVGFCLASGVSHRTLRRRALLEALGSIVSAAVEREHATYSPEDARSALAILVECACCRDELAL